MTTGGVGTRVKAAVTSLAQKTLSLCLELQVRSVQGDSVQNKGKEPTGKGTNSCNMASTRSRAEGCCVPMY